MSVVFGTLVRFLTNGRPPFACAALVPRQVLFFFIFLAAQKSLAQEAIRVQPPAASSASGVPYGLGVPTLSSRDSFAEPGRLRSLNISRQKSLVSDAARLLSLANELNAELAQSTTDSVTRAQMKKMSEIEKLARDVKFKMSNSLVDPLELRPPVFPRQ